MKSDLGRICRGPIVLAIFLAACASAPPERSRVQQEALDANRNAARAFEHGRLEEARALYTRALKLDLSVENADGMAVNLLSLARIEQASGKPQAAHEYLDRVLSGMPLPTPDRQAEAAARKAQLYLDSRDPASAAGWGARAEQLCANACTALPAILNLRAREALQSGDPARALDWAQRAVAAAQGSGARAEHANGLRLSAESRLARGEPEPALRALGEALALDQSLGLPRRIYRDLILLGRASELGGRREEARSYYERAQSGASTSDNADAVREARSRLDGM